MKLFRFLLLIVTISAIIFSCSKNVEQTKDSANLDLNKLSLDLANDANFDSLTNHATMLGEERISTWFGNLDKSAISKVSSITILKMINERGTAMLKNNPYLKTLSRDAFFIVYKKAVKLIRERRNNGKGKKELSSLKMTRESLMLRNETLTNNSVEDSIRDACYSACDWNYNYNLGELELGFEAALFWGAWMPYLNAQSNCANTYAWDSPEKTACDKKATDDWREAEHRIVATYDPLADALSVAYRLCNDNCALH